MIRRLISAPTEAMFDLLSHAPLSPRTRAALTHVIGRADEAWYWLYQGALCALGDDPGKADAMYERGPRGEAHAWQDVVQRLRDGPDEGHRDGPAPNRG